MMTKKKSDIRNLDQLLPSLNRVPSLLKTIHLIGICGTGMASLAGILKQQGFRVTGSDQHIYPPMSHFLEDLSIPVFRGYQSKNLKPIPDLVIVGNVIPRENPEAIELSRLSALLANELGQLITNLDADRVMFGTGMPFNYPDPALVKLEVLDATEPDKDKIRSQNAATWLRL